MKKVLIITYYWPPSGGGGVQRWLKFVKYLPKFEWEPIVYSPENPEYPSIDYSLQKDVDPGLIHIKQPIFEPYNIYKQFIGAKKSERINTGFLSESKKPKISENFAVWIRGNFFIPDARKFWIKPSIKYLSKYLKDNPVDLIITTGPPHSMHLIGLGLKKKLGLKWIADFRDPWTNIDFYDELKLSKWANKKHHKLEQEVINNADGIIGVGNGYLENLLPIPKTTPVTVITNGFDQEDFNDLKIKKSEAFSICHFGSMNKTRNPIGLWKALSSIYKDNPANLENVKVKLFGITDHIVLDSINKYGLNEFVETVDYLPHSEMMQELINADLLLLMINNIRQGSGLIPGKVFEYIGSGKPILGIGPIESHVSEILKESESGEMIDWEDSDSIKRFILKTMENRGKPNDNKNKNRYSREFLTSKLTTFFDQVI